MFIILVVRALLTGEFSGFNADGLRLLLGFFMVAVTLIVVAVPRGVGDECDLESGVQYAADDC